jgi:AcrR family transcriptional regulator
MTSEDRRRQLTQCALAAIAADSNEELSLDAVAERAGVTRNLLYHYFPRGRRDLELAAVEEAASQLLGKFDTDPSTPLDQKQESNLAGFVTHAWERSDAWQGYVELRSRLDSEVRAGIDRYRDSIVEAISLNNFGTEAPGPYAHAALRGFLEFGAEMLNQGREAGLDIEGVLAVLREVLEATVEAVRPHVAATEG